MRVRQLLWREPFAAILVRTLERYWGARHGRTFRVQWEAAGTNTSPGSELWHGNWHLNYFATASTPAECFDAVRRQYGRSVSRWKRPWQYLYVRAATHRDLRRLFSQVAFSVQPASPDGGRCLVIGGNRRLRLLDPAGGTCTVLRKDGFAPGFTANELAFRRQGGWTFIPQLLEVAPDESWFTERYIAGHGATRVNAARAARVVNEAAGHLCDQVIAPSLKSARSAEWSARLVDDVRVRLARWKGPPMTYRREVEELAGKIGRVAVGTGGRDTEIGVAWSHGDFQAGNIMEDDRGVWIVDWESVARRFAGYDPLTLALGSRGPGRLRAKVQALLQDPGNPAHRLLSRWPGVDWAMPARPNMVAIYLLEELLFHLQENGDPMFYDAAANFRGYFEEIAEAAALLP